MPSNSRAINTWNSQYKKENYYIFLKSTHLHFRTMFSYCCLLICFFNLTRHAADVILASKPNDEVDVSAISPLEGLLKEGSTPEDLFKMLVSLGIFSEQEALEVVLHPTPLDFSEEILRIAQDIAASPPQDK